MRNGENDRFSDRGAVLRSHDGGFIFSDGNTSFRRKTTFNPYRSELKMKRKAENLTLIGRLADMHSVNTTGMRINERCSIRLYVNSNSCPNTAYVA